MNQRPKLDKSISPNDFQDFYWLKKELVEFCRTEDLSTSGGKIEITKRISLYLTTGEKIVQRKKVKEKKTSTFDWYHEPLNLETKITDNYKNTEHVRTFFEKEIGKGFKFNVVFMKWMKANIGKTLQEAITMWHTINKQRKTNSKPKNIAPQFEYNRYLRDFLADNPELSRATGIQLWNIKKSMRGNNVYHKTDLALLKS